MAIQVTQVGLEVLYGVESCALIATQVGIETIGPCTVPLLPPPESTPSDPALVGNVLGRPLLHVGLRDSEPAVLRVGVGFLDDGECYEMLARTRRTAPAGPGGECVFTAIYLAVTQFDVDTTLFVTPIVDGVRGETQALVLLGANGSVEGETRQYELDIMQPYIRGAVERLRHAPRGTWFQLEVSALCGELPVPAAQIVDAAEVEYEVVRESMGAIS